MEIITTASTILTIVIQTVFLTKYLLQNNFKLNIYLCLLIIYEIFFVLPLLMQIMIGKPILLNYGYIFIYDNLFVDLIYNIIVNVISIPFFYHLRKYSTGSSLRLQTALITLKQIKYGRLGRILLYLGSVAPVMVAILAPYPSIYFCNIWGMYTVDHITVDIRDFHDTVMVPFLYGSLLCLFLLWIKRNNKSKNSKTKFIVTCYLCCIAIIDLLFSSKRTLGLLSIVLLLIIDLLMSGKRIPVKRCILVVLFCISYFWIYQKVTKKTVGGGQISFNAVYYSYFSRMVDLKYVIYSLIHPENVKILDYPFQSYVADLLFFVPRQIWPDKPFPFGDYYTAAWQHQAVTSVVNKYYVSYFSEAICNIGWSGSIIAPIVYMRIARYLDKQNNIIIYVFGLWMMIYFMVTQFQSNIKMILIFVILLIGTKIYRKFNGIKITI